MPRQRWAIPVFLACMHLVALPQRGEGGVDVPGKKGPKPLKRSNRITIDGDKVNYEHVTKNRSRLLITPYGAFRAPVQTAENAQMQSYFRHGKDTVGVEEKTPAALASAEAYDPGTNRWSAIANMSTARVTT